MAKVVALIDDDAIPMSYYRRAFERDGYDVRYLKTAAACRALLTEEQVGSVHFFVIDVIMAPRGLYSAEESAGGAFTGLLLARDLRDVGHVAPIILFSNTNIDEIRSAAQRMGSRLDDCIFLRKADAVPRELADIVDRYFKQAKLEAGSRRILQKLFGSMLLQPNLGGVGVDLKRLGE